MLNGYYNLPKNIVTSIASKYDDVQIQYLTDNLLKTIEEIKALDISEEKILEFVQDSIEINKIYNNNYTYKQNKSKNKKRQKTK